MLVVSNNRVILRYDFLLQNSCKTLLQNLALYLFDPYQNLVTKSYVFENDQLITLTNV